MRFVFLSLQDRYRASPPCTPAKARNPLFCTSHRIPEREVREVVHLRAQAPRLGRSHHANIYRWKRRGDSVAFEVPSMAPAIERVARYCCRYLFHRNHYPAAVSQPQKRVWCPHKNFFPPRPQTPFRNSRTDRRIRSPHLFSPTRADPKQSPVLPRRSSVPRSLCWLDDSDPFKVPRAR